jgi:cbb3-type cytochrome oxidase maturation protein
MSEATIALTVMTLLILVIFLGLLVWGIRSRQFHNIEEAKYRMLHSGDNIDKEVKQDSHQEKRS